MQRSTVQAAVTGQTSAPAVAILGAGIGGMQAALLLAALGRRAALIERAPWIGGSFHLHDYTFPTDSCGLCFLEPGQAPTYCPTFECQRHPLVSLHPLTVVKNVEGTVGQFLLTLQTNPRFVLEDLCDGCGLCSAACRTEGPSMYEGNLTPTKAIYAPPARALPSAYVIDPDLCTRCGLCVDACPQGAIDLQMQPVKWSMHAGAVIASPGLQPFAAERAAEYGYGVFENVITSLQFERLISYSGSTAGRLVRPSDGRPARKIAFISCVGSRDARLGRDYCSSVCCMITAKQATIAHQLDSHVQSTVFFMDLRASGRDYERYLDHRVESAGIHYQRCQVSTIKQRQQSRDLLIEYWTEAGERRVDRFDLVVLAVGLEPETRSQNWGIPLDSYGFAESGLRIALGNDRQGIVPTGGMTGPKDLTETVIEASAAAALAAARVLPADHAGDVDLSETIRPGLMEEEPRLGAFLCDDTAMDGDTRAELASQIGLLPGIMLTADISSTAGSAWQDEAVRQATEAGVNRLLLVHSADRLDVDFERQSALVMRALGLPDSAGLTLSLREHSTAHREASASFLSASFRAIGMAIADLRYRPISIRETVEPAELPTTLGHTAPAVVIGGGPAGLAAATTLADLGWDVTLLERTGRLGGRLHEIEFTAAGKPTKDWLKEQTARAAECPRLTVQTDVEILGVRAIDNGYAVGLRKSGGEEQLACQAVILATGGEPADTQRYGHGRHPSVITQSNLEAMLKRGAAAIGEMQTVVMIQCVDSRDEARPYCSRTCCPQAIRNALRLKQISPGMDIFVLYREMRTPGMGELIYQAARKAGVIFMRYELPELPQIDFLAEQGLRVRVVDKIVNRPVDIDADLLVLSTGLKPADSLSWLGELDAPRDADGFLLPEHAKMRPLNLGKPGLLACGNLLGPCSVEEAVAQGQGAAIQAAIHLRRQAVRRPVHAAVATVHDRLCSGCELCVRTCPYGARVMDREYRIARVIEQYCAGCGACAMVCPNGATQQRLFGSRSVMAVIDAALEGQI